MYCRNCGKEMNCDDKFCVICGYRNTLAFADSNGTVVSPICATPVKNGNGLWATYVGMLKKILVIKERSTPSDFWYSVLGQVICALVSVVIANLFISMDVSDASSLVGTILSYIAVAIIGLYYIVSFVAMTTLSIRRLHDIGVTGWLLPIVAFLLGLVSVLKVMPGVISAVYGILIIGMIVLFSLKSTGPNKYSKE